MAAYPSLPTAAASAPDYVDGRTVDVGGDGLARVRKIHADRRRWQVVHPMLRADQVATLEAHYAANITATFNYTAFDDGVTYSVCYAARPRYTLHLGGLRSATVQLSETL